MEQFQPVLLDIWREACRHIEIPESVATCARLLARHMPIGLVMVQPIDFNRLCFETTAIGRADESLTANPIRPNCSPGEIKRLLAWCRRGEVAHLSRHTVYRSAWAVLFQNGVERDALLGPLTLRERVLGMLILLARPDLEFDSRHEQMMQTLLEPFSMALENDNHLRELATLREAAEADKRTLLARLGREELIDTIIGREDGLRVVMERVGLVARSDVPVLIIGETGTGKEVIARAIHTLSPRASGPFIRVNCGAIPSELIDSQLFGHERGSFTGATNQRKGWFERAHGGTLFLDEIGELSLAAQVRLLRILQDGYLERVGGQDPLKVEVRVVAATHRDLLQMVHDGRFREDLWYRIAVFPILLPPLRERCADIPALARHFAQCAAIRFGFPPKTPSDNDIALLVSYPWPGNVRELASVIDRSVILGEGERLEVAMALGVFPYARDTLSQPGQTQPQAAVGIASLNEVMKRHIETALAATKGRIEGPYGAACLLQINPHTLRARMRKLGIDWRRLRPKPSSAGTGHLHSRTEGFR
jgi:Transcriptional regulator containing GAF, AAA-type ATPase, and DNA binding domains